MRVVTRVLIAAALAFGLGCAQTDWIDRTLVTEDVTETWSGLWSGPRGAGEVLWFELEQRGSTIKGFIRFTAGSAAAGQGDRPGPIEGTVAGDVFRFRQMNGSLEGELTVSGDEMNGRASLGSNSRPLSLRRVDASSRPGLAPR
jgi:hypothetical protein